MSQGRCCTWTQVRTTENGEYRRQAHKGAHRASARNNALRPMCRRFKHGISFLSGMLPTVGHEPKFLGHVGKELRTGRSLPGLHYFRAAGPPRRRKPRRWCGPWPSLSAGLRRGAPQSNAEKSGAWPRPCLPLPYRARHARRVHRGGGKGGATAAPRPLQHGFHLHKLQLLNCLECRAGVAKLDWSSA
jgi:hypothetical protein